MPAGERHWRWRLYPRLDLYPRALPQSFRRVLGGQGEAQAWHLGRRRKREANVVLGDEMLKPLDAGVDRGDGDALEPRRRDPFAAGPDEPASRGKRQSADEQGAAETPLPPSKPAGRDPERQHDEGAPLRWPR